VRRIIIALVALAVLAFLFPLSDDDVLNHLDSRQLTISPDSLLTPDAQLTSVPPAQGPPTRAPDTPSNSPRTTPATDQSRAPTSTPTSTAASCQVRASWTVTYVVRPGDTLDGIARLVGIPVSSLIEGNCLVNPNRIAIGQEIRVPELPSPSSTPAARP
jgi:LysM repeat protein